MDPDYWYRPGKTWADVDLAIGLFAGFVEMGDFAKAEVVANCAFDLSDRLKKTV